jgi:ribosomal protein S18 acetylase RimI-like enzyme
LLTRCGWRAGQTGGVDITVRLARPREYDAVGALTARAYLDSGLVPDGSDYDETLRRASDRAEHSELLVAVDAGGELLGTVSFVRAGSRYAEVSREGEAEFRMLAVDPGAQGRGVGTGLLRRVLDYSRARGSHGIVCSSLPEMRAAHRIYRRLGFRRAPERDWSPLAGVDLLAFAISF